jgi:hypothetical protein
MVEPHPVSRPAPAVESVELSVTAGVARLTIRGCLDGETGRALAEVARAAVTGEVVRLDLDLRSVSSFDQAGADALLACRELGADLAEGLHYRTGQGAGRAALLAAYQRS